MKECASRLVRLAKGSGITVFIVGHVTKSGTIAGPKVVEHMVDTVLYLEGDRFNSYRYGTPPPPATYRQQTRITLLRRLPESSNLLIVYYPLMLSYTGLHPNCTALQRLSRGSLY